MYNYISINYSARHRERSFVLNYIVGVFLHLVILVFGLLGVGIAVAVTNYLLFLASMVYVTVTVISMVMTISKLRQTPDNDSSVKSQA